MIDLAFGIFIEGNNNKKKKINLEINKPIFFKVLINL